MSTPAISIVIPIYNKSDYLDQTFDSICKQSFADYEVICMDDGSTDESLAICEKYSEFDKRFRVFHNENNGAAIARNMGLDRAVGNYVVFLDADDSFHSNMLEEAYKAIVQSEAQLAVWSYNEVSPETGDTRRIALGDGFYHHSDITMEHLYQFRTVPWNKLIHRKFLVDSGIRFQNLPTENDVFFSNALVLTAEKIVTISEPLVDYQCGLEGSITHNRLNKKSNFLLAYDKIYEYLEKRDKTLAVAFINLILTWIWNMITSGDSVNVRSMAIDMPVCTNLNRAFNDLSDEEGIKYINKVFIRLLMNESADQIGTNPYRYTIPVFKSLHGKVAVCGAGFRCHKLLQALEEHDIQIECVADNNPDLSGTMIFGYPIYSFSEAYSKADTFVVLNEDHFNTMKAQLGDRDVINYSRLEYEWIKEGKLKLKKYANEKYGKWAINGNGVLFHYYQLLLMRMGITPEYIIDRSIEKGTFKNGMQVITPDELTHIDCRIAACEDGVFIDSLKALGIDVSTRVYGYKELLWLYTASIDIRRYVKETSGNESKAPSVLIDAFGGIGWGGTEIWSYKVGRGLSDRGYQVRIIGATCQEPQDKWEDLIIRIAFNRADPLRMFDSVIKIARYMADTLPFVLINNWTEEVFCAAYLLKRLYPAQIHIMSIIHNDVNALYENVRLWHEQMELISCVSLKIKDKICNEIGVAKDKVFSKENFVDTVNTDFDNVRYVTEPLHIGWAARLEVEQKRADLLPKLVEELDKTGLKYVFQIAGDGRCYDMLKDWIIKSGHSDRVILRGLLSQSDMEQFWKAQNVYVNISEYEGASLAMLEAMSYGVTPVVTNVSGVKEFVDDGQNGYIRDVGDLESIASCIAHLGEHEGLRYEYSKRCIRTIIEKCGFDRYISYMSELVGKLIRI